MEILVPLGLLVHTLFFPRQWYVQVIEPRAGFLKWRYDGYKSKATATEAMRDIAERISAGTWQPASKY
jgi:hypothetical protein